ncbi:unnamed protein product [Lactuca saligna]|uniref:Uncharacterized protein n=1 Tax=Lactuca saligna TaxID=75948 RepID=A0AA35ZJN2_LACSI|nr:unnamed protein product [Lactuca saligna]
MTLLYGLYTGMNIDFGSVLWAQLIHSTISTSRHTEISCARFWSLIVRRAIVKQNIPTMQDILAFTISTLHTTWIIVADASKFSFIGSILEVMFRDVPASSKILEGFRKPTPSGFRPLTPYMQAAIDVVDKPKKGGKGSKKGEKKIVTKEGPSGATKPSSKKRKAPAASFASTPKRRKHPARKRKTPTPSAREESDFETDSNVRIEETQLVRNEEPTANPEPLVHNTEGTTNQELLSSKSSSSDAYSKATVESLFECITKQHVANAAKMNAAVSKSADVRKSTTQKFNKLISKTTTFMENYITTYNNNIAFTNEALQNLGAMFKTEKINLEKIHTGLQQDHASF